MAFPIKSVGRGTESPFAKLCHLPFELATDSVAVHRQGTRLGRPVPCPRFGRRERDAVARRGDDEQGRAQREGASAAQGSSNNSCPG